jgi:hypothetical protein
MRFMAMTSTCRFRREVRLDFTCGRESGQERGGPTASPGGCAPSASTGPSYWHARINSFLFCKFSIKVNDDFLGLLEVVLNVVKPSTRSGQLEVNNVQVALRHASR